MRDKAQFTFQSNADYNRTEQKILPKGETMITNQRVSGARPTLRGLLIFRLNGFLDWQIELTPSAKVIVTGPASQIERLPKLIQELALVIVPMPNENTGKTDFLTLKPLDHDIPDENWAKIWREKQTPVTAASAPLVSILGLQEGGQSIIIAEKDKRRPEGEK